MKRSANNTKSFNSQESYYSKHLQQTKSEIVNSLKDFNDRKSSKEQTLNDLELIQRKINAKLKSFRPN